MKMPPVSHSGLTAFETCGHRYYLTKVVKTVHEPQTSHTLWGNKVHTALENRLMKRKPLPEGIEHYEPIVEKLEALRPVAKISAELRLALTRDLRATNWDSPMAWVRCIIDVVVDKGRAAFLGDWKTGKVKHDHDQLNMSSVMYLAAKPNVEKVRADYIWLAHNTVTSGTITRDQAPEVWQGIIKRIDRLNDAYQTNTWPKNPSGLCKGWCPVGRENCEFYEPPRNR